MTSIPNPKIVELFKMMEENIELFKKRIAYSFECNKEYIKKRDENHLKDRTDI